MRLGDIAAAAAAVQPVLDRQREIGARYRLSPEAVDATVTLLARLAVWRHGSLPVLRGLTRRERAPESIAAL
ncbi:MAG: hypothetical protein ACRDTU_23380 [Micromonosporaceae bacterium]